MAYKQLKDKTGTDFEPMTPSKVGYPQASSTITMSSGVTYTAPSNGHIKSNGEVSQTAGESKISVNGIAWYNESTGNPNTSWWGNRMVAVRKGDAISATYPSSGGGGVVPPRPRILNSLSGGVAE